MNVLATFSGAKYHDTTRRIVEDAPRLGADAVWVYDDVWERECRPGFWDRVRWFREHPGARGVDWFAFKPRTVLDAFARLNPGDVLLFCDADTYPVASLLPLFDRCRADGGAMLFSALGCLNRAYVKRDCLLCMNADGPAYLDVEQAVARFMLFERGGAFPAERFLWDWLAYTLNPLCNTFDPSVMAPEHDGFIQHRCEQAVLGVLSVRYGVRLYREACQNGDGCDRDRDVFPTTFFQEGRHSYAPGAADADGSRFRNVAD